MPLAVLERQTEAEDQRVPLGGVVGPLVETLDASSKEPSLSSTAQAAVTGPGLCPPPSKWMVADFIASGAFSPMMGDCPINALSMQSKRFAECWTLHAKQNFRGGGRKTG